MMHEESPSPHRGGFLESASADCLAGSRPWLRTYITNDLHDSAANRSVKVVLFYRESTHTSSRLPPIRSVPLGFRQSDPFLRVFVPAPLHRDRWRNPPGGSFRPPKRPHERAPAEGATPGEPCPDNRQRRQNRTSDNGDYDRFGLAAFCRARDQAGVLSYPSQAGGSSRRVAVPVASPALASAWPAGSWRRDGWGPTERTVYHVREVG